MTQSADATGPIPVPRAVLFDLDGTLADSLPDIHAALDGARRELGLPGVSVDAVRGWVGCGAAMLAARSLGHEDERCEDTRRLLAAFLRRYESHADERSVLYPGALDLLDALRVRGIQLCVATNKPLGAAEALLGGLGIRDHFDLLVTPEVAGVRKPDPGFMTCALEYLNVGPDESIVVGDGLPDIESAHAAGIRCVAILGGYGAPAALVAAKPRWCARDVAEVGRRMGVLP